MTLTKGQSYAVKRAVKWYFNESKDKKLFGIQGYAGTGKTSLVRVLINILGLASYQVVFTSFTGKAASVLRRKGIPAMTIHRTFYNIYKIDNKIRFKKKKNLSASVKLIVIDELSMVNDNMMNDILSFNIPILALGDNAQLPPVFGANRFMESPDVFLDEIMRQKGDVGILDLAGMARKGEYIPFGKYTESRVIKVRDIEDIEGYDAVLCWKNSTRRNLNLIIRERLRRNSKYPLKGEKLICLKNNYVHLLEYDKDIPIFLVNGMDLKAHNDSGKPDAECFSLEYAPGYVEGVYFDTAVHRGPFDAYQSGEDFIIPAVNSEEAVFLDFGYACTIHKSQGSEWGDILLIDEFKGAEEQYNKWLYTGITRAKKSVTIARYY